MPADLPVDPDEVDREGFESDDEHGPQENDDEEDAGLVREADAVEPASGAGEEEEEVVEADDDADGTAAEEAPQNLNEAGAKKLKKTQLKEALSNIGENNQEGSVPELLARLLEKMKTATVLDAWGVVKRGRGRGRASGGGRSQSEPPRPKFSWEQVDPTRVSRPAFAGAHPKFVPAPDLGLTHESHPGEYFNKFISKADREMIAVNSTKYRHRQRALGNTSYPESTEDFTLADVDDFITAHITNGINPVPSQRALHKRSFSIKGVRAADVLTSNELKVLKAFLHVSDPMSAPGKDSPKFDELHKVRPLLASFLEACMRNVIPGKKVSIDEITIGFQGHHSKLKQRCGKYKRAGDGFQADAIVLEGGYLYFMVFRGDNTAPTWDKDMSPLHNRCLSLLAKMTDDGLELCWDNLYPSVEVAQKIAKGGEFQAQVCAPPRAAPRALTPPLHAPPHRCRRAPTTSSASRSRSRRCSRRGRRGATASLARRCCCRAPTISRRRSSPR